MLRPRTCITRSPVVPNPKDDRRVTGVYINKQWRICFAWQGGHALDVEITDYH